MIIFTPIKNINPELIAYKGISTVIKYNLTSYYADMPKLGCLNPSVEYIPENVLSGDCSDPMFDMEFHRYIFDNDAAFIQLMDIVVPEYMQNNPLVQILIDMSEFRNIIAESLMKLIQQRYGCNSYYVMTEEDFMYIEPQTFSIPGLFNLDQDIARWTMLVGSREDFEDA